ncbi:MAG: Spy/CpxP family protein refolding chaperone [Ghiorsea sp.]
MTQINRKKNQWITGLSVALAAMLAVGGSNIIYASPHSGEAKGDMLERMTQGLDLTDQQQQQVKQIHRENRITGMTVHDAMQDNREAMRKLDLGAKNYKQQVEKLAGEQADHVKQMIVHHADVRVQIYALLTPEQQDTLTQMKRHPRDEGFKRGDRPHQRCNN